MNPARLTTFLALFLVALVLIITPSLRAADNSDWANLKQLTPGQKAKVSLRDGKSYQGDLQSVSDDALVIHSASGDQTLPRQTVQRVSIKRNGHRGRHALIGAAIGAGAGLGFGVAVDNCSPTVIICTGNKGKAILTPAFALIGAGIGALFPVGAWQEIYRSR
ncbi:MAG TPA: hypothetical protein VN943_16635 [Candidatus Acidoferrum sp.]|nr:hypothetical protein [Candidatus Acidoferrum sp.]